MVATLIKIILIYLHVKIIWKKLCLSVQAAKLTNARWLILIHHYPALLAKKGKPGGPSLFSALKKTP